MIKTVFMSHDIPLKEDTDQGGLHVRYNFSELKFLQVTVEKNMAYRNDVDWLICWRGR